MRSWFFVLLLAFTVTAPAWAEESAPAITTAPEFTLPDLAKKPHSLEEYRKRGPVMLVFFTTWCPNCLREIPALKAIYREYEPKGLQLVAVNVGLMDSFEKAQAYALKHKLPYPVLYDENAVIANRYGVKAFPRIFLIRGDGSVFSDSTKLSEEQLSQFLNLAHE